MTKKQIAHKRAQSGMNKKIVLMIFCVFFAVAYLGVLPIVAANMSENFQKEKLYFAYGSNMDLDQMKLRCLDAELWGVAQIQGYQFMINGKGVASLSKSPDHFVQGVLWNISDYDEAMLDLFEGVAGGFYLKENLLVEDLTSGKMLEALVYLATDLNFGEPRSEYLEKIIRAAKEHKLNELYIEELHDWKVQKE